MALRLGIDLGTSNTVAVLESADGVVRPVLFDGSETLPSAVFLDDHGTLLTGRDALHAARSAPDRFEPHPKRTVDERTVLLGGTEVAVVDLLAAPLRRVAAEAHHEPGAQRATLTCPAGWGTARRTTLVAAARAAGLGRVRLVAEPVAAAAHHLARSGSDLPVGSRMLVYDFGAGTFDASVVRRTADGFEVLATHGRSDVGGLDIDAALADALGAPYADRDPALWQRLLRPDTAADRRARLAWQQDVRTAKELLSRAASTTVFVPLFDDTALLGRPELERVAGPVVAETVRAARSALRAARTDRRDLAAVLFVGGSSRMPLAATMVHRALGVAPTVVERPELVVAEGALGVADGAALPEVTPVSLVKVSPPMRRRRRTAETTGTPPERPGRPRPATTRATTEAVGPPPQRTRAVAVVVGVAMIVALLAAAVETFGSDDPDPGPTGAAPSASTPVTTSVAAAAASLSPQQCLVGVWRVTRDILAFPQSTPLAAGESQGGSVYSFGADGTLGSDHGTSTPITVTQNGVRFSATTTGATTAQYAATVETITAVAVTSTEVRTLRRNDSVTERRTVRAGDRATWGYDCASGELLLCRSAGLDQFTLRRTSTAPSGVPAALPPSLGRHCES